MFIWVLKNFKWKEDRILRIFEYISNIYTNNSCHLSLNTKKEKSVLENCSFICVTASISNETILFTKSFFRKYPNLSISKEKLIWNNFNDLQGGISVIKPERIWNKSKLISCWLLLYFSEIIFFRRSKKSCSVKK